MAPARHGCLCKGPGRPLPQEIAELKADSSFARWSAHGDLPAFRAALARS
jgi:hypothetical protein